METAIQRIIRKLELNENLVSTFLGGLVMIFVISLFIGYYRSNNTPTEVTAPQSEFGEIMTEDIDAGETSSAAISSYTVNQDDTLWSIAEETYGDGFMWTQIAEVNNISNPDNISEGTRLDLPRNADLNQPTNSQNIAGAQDNTEQINNVYTVQKGDSLWNIAQNTYNDGYQWTTIWQANREQIANPNILITGMQLTLPSIE